MENAIMNSGFIKVLICDDTVETGVKLASELSKLSMFAYTRKNEGDVILHSILSDKPDIVVSDLSLNNGSDSITVMNKAQSILSQCPEFIIYSEVNNSFIKKQILENGASYFLAKPFDVNKLFDAIHTVLSKEKDKIGCEAEIMVTELIQKLGVPANVRGYGYIRTAILECVENRECLNSVTKVLYPSVAAKHETTATRVERAIRHAIETAWHRGNRSSIYKILGYRSDIFSKPTNSEFISLAADKIRLLIKSKIKYRDDING